MKSKVSIPVIVIAVIGLVAFLVFMGKKTISGPEAIHTQPPPWIDAATGKPKGAMKGSGENTPTFKGGPPAGTPAGGGR